MPFYVKYNNLLSITVVQMFAKVLCLDLREVTGYGKNINIIIYRVLNRGVERFGFYLT